MEYCNNTLCDLNIIIRKLLREPILLIFYLYILINFLFGLYQIKEGTFLGQCYLNMDFKCYLFNFIFRSFWFERFIEAVFVLLVLDYLFKKILKRRIKFLPTDWKRNILVTSFKWSIPFLFVLQVYFTLKVYGSVRRPHLPLWSLESHLWLFLYPLFSSLPKWSYKFLDFVYVPLWISSHWVFLLVNLSSNEGLKRKLYGVYGISLIIFGILHCLFPATSPIYVKKSYFNYLTQKLSSWHYHKRCLKQQNLFLEKGAEAFRILEGKAITPIAAFPSFHVGYSLLLFLIAYRSFGKALSISSFLFLIFTILGSVILGFHYITDIFFGLGVVYILFRSVEEIEEKFYRN